MSRSKYFSIIEDILKFYTLQKVESLLDGLFTRKYNFNLLNCYYSFIVKL